MKIGIPIKNNESVVKSYTQPGLSESGRMELSSVIVSGAKGVHSEQACNLTYESGIKVTEVIKEHLNATFQCMNDTSHALQETDLQAAKNNAGIRSMKKI